MITTYEKYIFLLCSIVFVMLTALFSTLIYNITKLTVRLIRHGAEDEKLEKAYCKTKQERRACKTATTIISWILCAALIGFFIFSAWLRHTEDSFSTLSSLKVVNSSSMSYKNEKNEYLFKNNLNDQFNTFDLIVTHEIPNEFELELYDIIVYEYGDILIIHRIVGIEEPNADHPEGRLFRLQGDAVGSPDTKPVSYSQMKAIYHGERVPFIGSFVFFMQSPAGWLCILLIILSSIATPIVERKLEKEAAIRLETINKLIANTATNCNEDTVNDTEKNNSKKQ